MWRDAATRQMEARGAGKATRFPSWPPVGTPRMVGRGFPRPPGVPLPRIHEDGSGPLDLGLEPPRKKQAKLGRDGKEKDPVCHRRFEVSGPLATRAAEVSHLFDVSRALAG